ncbi:MAG: HDOD domain-containing protein [Nitrospirae bacterium]|nr:HDOD domain-containing protein [Nitrospirota bacterium]
MDNSLILQEANKIVAAVGIPTMPAIVAKITNEARKPNPNFAVIAEMIKEDIGLSAKVLKLANSAMFGAGKVDSVARALMIMGFGVFYNVILSTAITESLKKFKLPQATFKEFWEHSMFMAMTCALITKRLSASDIGIVSEDKAYTAGLFHDCGIPLIIMRHGDTEDLYRYGQTDYSNIMLGEDDLISTNHCALGGLVAKSWKLDTFVISCIQLHHNPPKSIKDDSVRLMNVILTLAECFYSEHFTTFKDIKNYDEAGLIKNITTGLDMAIEEYQDLRDEVADKIVKAIADSSL